MSLWVISPDCLSYHCYTGSDLEFRNECLGLGLGLGFRDRVRVRVRNRVRVRVRNRFRVGVRVKVECIYIHKGVHMVGVGVHALTSSLRCIMHGSNNGHVLIFA